MSIAATSPSNILRFLVSCAEEGLKTALVTLTAIVGSAPRSIGAQMAVAEDGRFAGSFSGGCIEAAIVAEAMDTMVSGRARIVRYGAASPYIDVRLPCGGGIDLLFNPCPSRDAVEEILLRLERRASGSLRLPGNGLPISVIDAEEPGFGWRSNGFELTYVPKLRLVIVGQGEEPIALASLACAFGADVSVLSPARRDLLQLVDPRIHTIPLTVRNVLPPVQTDPWTALVFLFHDRDWEEILLPCALALPGFYVGAVGGRKTQNARLESLRNAGVPERLRRKLETSVGLIPAARDSATLALSILSQIVEAYHRIDALNYRRSGAASRGANMSRTKLDRNFPMI